MRTAGEGEGRSTGANCFSDSLAHSKISIYSCGINESQVISQCSQANQFKRMKSLK